jgi:hypothetical protein
MSAAMGGEFTVASHEVLFVPSDEARCDACGCEIDAQANPDDPASSIMCNARGTYLWIRGGEATLESVPLCSACASAIGATTLARWEIEEEEG